MEAKLAKAFNRRNLTDLFDQMRKVLEQADDTRLILLKYSMKSSITLCRWLRRSKFNGITLYTP